MKDHGHRVEGELPEGTRIHRDLAPADDPETAAAQDSFGDGLCLDLIVGTVDGEEKDAHSKIGVGGERPAQLSDGGTQNLVGDMGHDPGAVAGFAIRVDRAAMGHVRDGI